MRTAREDLDKKISAYLAEKPTVEVSDADLQALADIVQGLIALKYRDGRDTALPIAAHLVDCNRFENPLVLNIRHPDLGKDPGSEAQLCFEGANTAATLAAHYAEKSKAFSQRGLTLLEEASERQAALQLFGQEYRQLAPEGVTPYTVHTAVTKTVRKHLKKEPCPVDFDQRQAWLRRVCAEASEHARVVVEPRLATHVHNGVRLSFHLPLFNQSLTIAPEKLTHAQ